MFTHEGDADHKWLTIGHSIGRSGDILAQQLPSACDCEITELWDSEFALTDNTLIFCVALRNSPEYPKESIFQYPKLRPNPCYLCRPQTEEHWYRLDLHSNTRNPKIMPRFLHAGVFFRLCGKSSHVVN